MEATTTYCRPCDTHHDLFGLPVTGTSACQLETNCDRFASTWAVTAERVREADKAEVRLSIATLRKAVQRLTDRLIAEMF